MNNEPVAWMMENPQNTSAYLTFEKPTREMKISHQAIQLYTHPAKTEEFMAGDAICPSCGCKSLYKTARSEWCVTHKCLWQKDYELTLTDEEIWDWFKENTALEKESALKIARAILRKAQDK